MIAALGQSVAEGCDSRRKREKKERIDESLIKIICQDDPVEKKYLLLLLLLLLLVAFSDYFQARSLARPCLSYRYHYSVVITYLNVNIRHDFYQRLGSSFVSRLVRAGVPEQGAGGTLSRLAQRIRSRTTSRARDKSRVLARQSACPLETSLRVDAALISNVAARCRCRGWSARTGEAGEAGRFGE